MAALAALLWLLALGFAGVAALRRWTRLDPLEKLAYGAPLGVVAGSLLLIPLASFFSLGPALVLLVGLCAIVAGAWNVGGAPRPRNKDDTLHPFGARVGWGAAIVLLVFMARCAQLAAGALTLDPTGLWAGHAHVWGDWSQHLGDVASFAYGENFPPSHPRLAGSPFAYHYLTSVTVAALVKLGLSPVGALKLHTGIFLVLTTLALFAFARRMAANERVAVVAVTLFLLGGGLGFFLTLGEMLRSPDSWGTLWRQPWVPVSQLTGNFRWLNVVLAYLLPQRSTLYGLPLGLFALTLLFQGGTTGERRPFVVAGIAAGLLPLAHLGTMLFLALVTPVLWLLFPRRGWLWFFALWALLALPVILLQQAGAGALAHIRFHLGWVAGPDPWWWFWIRNLGLFGPLLLIALLDRELLPSAHRRFLLAFMPLFAVANLVVFQPWDWDNTKVLVYWYLAACVLVAALIVRVWRDARALTRAGVVVGLCTMLLSGVLAHLDQALGRDRHRILTAEELRFAEEVRRRTPPRAVVAVGLRHNHPVTVLAGRRVVLGYPGWLWSQGITYQGREADVRKMFALDEEASRLFAAYGVDYVAIGPDERERLGADEKAFRARYPRVVDVPPYALYKVGR